MRITVYCASGMGNDPALRESAAALGGWIVQNGHELVYGGGNSGLMGILANEVFSAGGRVTGVLPANVGFIASRPQIYCTQVITEKDMPARKARMMELAEAFIALPGGVGTLDEVTEVITCVNIGLFDRKVVLFNVKGYYEPLRQQLRAMIENGFLTEDIRKNVYFADNVGDMAAFLSGESEI